MNSAIQFTTRAVAVAVVCGWLSQTAFAENNTATLKAQIATMVTELNDTKAADGTPKSPAQMAVQMESFIKKYADPAELAAIQEQKSLEKLSMDFATRMRAPLAKVLAHIADAAPKVSPDRTTYTFEIKDPDVSPQSQIVFVYNENTDRFHLKN